MLYFEQFYVGWPPENFTDKWKQNMLEGLVFVSNSNFFITRREKNIFSLIKWNMVYHILDNI